MASASPRVIEEEVESHTLAGDGNREWGKPVAQASGEPTQPITTPTYTVCTEIPYGAVDFKGMKEDDPATAEQCLEITERIFRCGATDHYQKDCPQRDISTTLAQSERLAPIAQKGSRPCRIKAASSSQKVASATVERLEARAPALAYAMRAQEEQDVLDVIKGTFSLYELLIHALIDPGSTHSYICIALPVRKGIQIDEIDQDILVINSLGHSVVVNKVYKCCPSRIQEYEFSADLIELPFHEFDVILGMDWLSRHQVIVDY
ncbi:uncharacterized protein LOC131176463 [Hevea brasiliensis]|uniref:uncharacterized protein LOC131176463 n=1 Tax=Hevea brasiliensis TaxID=3981 RepID=UPI0025D0703A|nr:uncharacterized protein LOC131176463 [Hevea brasiliensis]